MAELIWIEIGLKEIISHHFVYEICLEKNWVSVYFGRLTVVRSELVHKKNLYFYDSPFFLDITLFVCGRMLLHIYFPLWLQSHGSTLLLPMSVCLAVILHISTFEVASGKCGLIWSVTCSHQACSSLSSQPKALPEKVEFLTKFLALGPGLPW